MQLCSLFVANTKEHMNVREFEVKVQTIRRTLRLDFLKNKKSLRTLSYSPKAQTFCFKGTALCTDNWLIRPFVSFSLTRCGFDTKESIRAGENCNTLFNKHHMPGSFLKAAPVS